MFLAHDPVSNTEAQVSEFDKALLEAAAAQGVVFLAVDDAGNREIVPVDEVNPPDNYEGSFTLVEPVYVDDRMQAVVDVFNALEAVMFPEAVALSVDDDAPARVAARDPVQVFAENLAALREITKAGESR